MKVFNICNTILAMAFGIVGLSCDSATAQQQLTKNDKKINEIIAGMTLEEKVEMLHAKTIMSSEGIPRLGIQEMRYTDGPFGIREEIGEGFRPLAWTTDSATYFPTGSALAATWSPLLAYQYGKAMGTEARRRGKDVILGPAMNIQRLPVGGRTYEYLSEDPHLNALLAVDYTKGTQDAGTAVCLKHYALNNQETNRGTVDVIIAERPMREIYLKAFEAAVKEGGAMSVMPAYNKVNGYYGSENDYLNNVILRGEWGFNGFTVSDWGGTHSTIGAALGGLDVEMPGTDYLGKGLIEAVKNGEIAEELVDSKVRNILRVRFAIDAVPMSEVNKANPSMPEQQQTAYDVAAKSVVLLKNNGSILPIDTNKTRKIAVIGLNAELTTANGGMGAGVKTPYEVTPLQGLKNRANSNIEIAYAPAYKNFKGMFASWGGYDPAMLAQTIDEPIHPEMLAEAIEIAKDADVVLFFAGTNKSIETEGSDRTDITLPVSQDAIVEALAAVNPNIVTVIVSGGPVDLREVNKYSPAIVQAWWNGLEGGNALADILYGKITPSGKLPFTLPLKLEDSPAYAMGNFPQAEDVQGDIFGTQYRLDIEGQADMKETKKGPESHYTEGSLVGYRWFDTKGVPVMYPFGHGLSYVPFQYSNLTTNKQKYAENEVVEISFDLTNAGSREADEVAQLYVHRLNPSVEWPYKELKAFDRVTLKGGETKKITLKVPVKDLCYWNEATKQWTLDKGNILLLLGSSSSDIRLQTEMEI